MSELEASGYLCCDLLNLCFVDCSYNPGWCRRPTSKYLRLYSHLDLRLPNLVRSDQKIDPILKLFIEGFLPYYISSIGQNLYTCLIPDIRGDDPIMDKFRRYIVTTVDALDNDGPDEDTGGVLLKETAETAP